MTLTAKSVQTISVIVPENPFAPHSLRKVTHCLAALDVEKLMEWWPGQPHTPHRSPEKVLAIQRSLDWKRVTQIASYLLQKEVIDAPDRLDTYFKKIYQPKSLEPGRQWPPKVPRVVGYQRSEYPTFSNVLLHVNGAKLAPLKNTKDAAELTFDERSADLNFSVIDGQHRVNGAYLALKILQEENPKHKWEIASEIFIDLDKIGEPPRHQAQIFIDVNFYQKKVDKSLVADLFPTARGNRDALDNKERAQDLGRRLMLEVGPLVGMIQIPGIRFGVKDVVTLSTLNSAIEDVLDDLANAKITGLDQQADFIAQCLDAWLIASGRKEEVRSTSMLSADNVAYQGRVLVSFLTLLPACIWKLKKAKILATSPKSLDHLIAWLKEVMDRSGLRPGGRFLEKKKFTEKKYLGTGGEARFRDVLWAAASSESSVTRLSSTTIKDMASEFRGKVQRELAKK